MRELFPGLGAQVQIGEPKINDVAIIEFPPLTPHASQSDFKNIEKYITHKNLAIEQIELYFTQR